MNIYDVDKCKADIVRPGKTLFAWAQEHKPFAVCNASLYDFKTRIPIGTIVENGKFVHNDGNGFGCGVTWTSHDIQFGQPWDRAWREYLTGYISPVQNGKYVAPTFTDSYVFGCRLSRIGVGRKAGKPYIVTDDNVNLQEFALHAINQGFDTLVNLDGGGSRHLFYDNRLVYNSPRIPYNALAFYKDTPQEEKPTCPYPVPTRNLYYGCKGDDVCWMQWHLAKKGFACAVDGVFGSGTWKAVWEFQKTWTKLPDGICGPNTRRELLKGE